MEVAAVKSTRRLWIESILFSVGMLCCIVLYYFIRRGSLSTSLINRSLASEALVLIGLSFLLSSICFFFDKFDSYIIYRKYLGLTGFYAAVLHIFITVFLLQDRFPLNQWFGSHIQAFIPGLIAFVIFLVMALISNTAGAVLLGGKRWRMILRVGGYTAYFFLLLHTAFINYQGWVNWLTKPTTILPPFGLVAVIFMLLVYAARTLLWIALRKKYAV